MFTIGDFARLGRVSVRMLRHYDAIGLLRPAYVDRVSAMDNVIPTIQTLARWIDANGYRSVGYNLELYIGCGENRDALVTELREGRISQHSTCRQAGANRNPGSGDSGVLTENSLVYAGSESDGTSGSSTPSASASLRTAETWGSFVLPCSVNYRVSTVRHYVSEELTHFVGRRLAEDREQSNLLIRLP
jgi:hypothetical protein